MSLGCAFLLLDSVPEFFGSVLYNEENLFLWSLLPCSITAVAGLLLQEQPEHIPGCLTGAELVQVTQMLPANEAIRIYFVNNTAFMRVHERMEAQSTCGSWQLLGVLPVGSNL